MQDTYSFSLEPVTGAVYRAFVWRTMHQGYRPVTVVYDIAEGPLADLNLWLTHCDATVTHVRLPDGTLEEPDCLTVFEAAEALAL
jgi:hypothetical protein